MNTRTVLIVDDDKIIREQLRGVYILAITYYFWKDVWIHVHRPSIVQANIR